MIRRKRIGGHSPHVKRERLLNCTSGSSSSDSNSGGVASPRQHVLCIQASPNPEFAANPGNFAHFWMAFVFPLVLTLKDAGVSEADIFRAKLLVWHGNNRVLPKWSPQLVALLGGRNWSRSCASLASPALSSPAELAVRKLSFGCSTHVRMTVPLFSFRNRSFYAPVRWRSFSAAIRAQLAAVLGRGDAYSPATSLAGGRPAKVVVLLRESTSNRRVLGLDAACSRPQVACVRPGPREPLMQTASALARPGTRALIAGHGAALALLPFLPHGSRSIELDHVHNVGRARNMYVYLGAALGFDSLKVWLNDSGARFCPRRVLACTLSAGGTTVHGCSVGYTGQVLLTELMLRDVLRDAVADESTSPALVAARACSGVANDSWRGPKWWNIHSELNRPFPYVQ